MNSKRLAMWLCGVALAAATTPLVAQLGKPNAQGVSVGHVHLVVRDAEAHKKLWVLLGAEVTHAGSLELLKFPGLFVILTPGAPTDGSEGSTLNHFGFAVPNVDAVKARLTGAGLPTVRELTNPKRWVTTFPDLVTVEFLEVPTQTIPITGHHLHVSTTEMEPLRAWYLKTFGGAAETRRGFLSAVFDQGEVDMIQAEAPQAPTRGRSVDHIGFEVKDLAAFCKKLEAEGVKFDTPYREMPQLGGLKLAFITDPVGTRIELTEGLASR
jgi:catechol 2,3-dioxygenase-like lactoylglutathione lyase family enzyme